MFDSIQTEAYLTGNEFRHNNEYLTGYEYSR